MLSATFHFWKGVILSFSKVGKKKFSFSISRSSASSWPPIPASTSAGIECPRGHQFQPRHQQELSVLVATNSSLGIGRSWVSSWPSIESKQFFSVYKCGLTGVVLLPLKTIIIMTQTTIVNNVSKCFTTSSEPAHKHQQGCLLHSHLSYQLCCSFEQWEQKLNLW